MTNPAQKLMAKITPEITAPNNQCAKALNELNGILHIAQDLLAATHANALVVQGPEFKTAYANDLLVPKFIVFLRDFNLSHAELKAIEARKELELHAMLDPTIYNLTTIEISQAVMAWIDSFNNVVLPTAGELSDLVLNNLDRINEEYNLSLEVQDAK